MYLYKYIMLTKLRKSLKSNNKIELAEKKGRKVFFKSLAIMII